MIARKWQLLKSCFAVDSVSLFQCLYCFNLPCHKVLLAIRTVEM